MKLLWTIKQIYYDMILHWRFYKVQLKANREWDRCIRSIRKEMKKINFDGIINKSKE